MKLYNFYMVLVWSVRGAAAAYSPSYPRCGAVSRRTLIALRRGGECMHQVSIKRRGQFSHRRYVHGWLNLFPHHRKGIVIYSVAIPNITYAHRCDNMVAMRRRSASDCTIAYGLGCLSTRDVVCHVAIDMIDVHHDISECYWCNQWIYIA